MVAAYGTTRRARLQSTGMVYFIQAAGGGPIKIGYTAGPARIRRNTAQTYSPDDLVVRAECPGTKQTETLIHAMFAKSHVRGEFFDPSPELSEFVDAIAEGLDVNELLALPTN